MIIVLLFRCRQDTNNGRNLLSTVDGSSLLSFKGPIYKDSYDDLTKKLRHKEFLGKSYESANYYEKA